MEVPIPKLTIPEINNLQPAEVVIWLIQISLFFLGALALAFVIYGGVLYVTSGGDSEKTTKARNTIMYSILGVIVIVLSYAIVTWAAGLYTVAT